MHEFSIFLLGIAFGFIAVLSGLRLSEPNITDEELYRFCIVRKIELKDCKVPPMNLPKEQPHE